MTDLATKPGADGTLPEDDAVDKTAAEVVDADALDETVDDEAEEASEGPDETVADAPADDEAEDDVPAEAADDAAPDDAAPDDATDETADDATDEVADDENVDDVTDEVADDLADSSEDEGAEEPAEASVADASDETADEPEPESTDEPDDTAQATDDDAAEAAEAEADDAGEQEVGDAAEDAAPEGEEDALDEADEPDADDTVEPEDQDAGSDAEDAVVDGADETDAPEDAADEDSDAPEDDAEDALAGAAVVAAVAEPAVEPASVETLPRVETAATVQLAPGATGADGATYAWAPTEPEKKKRRRALWIGIAAGAAVVALVASSLVLIAPGTSVAGVSVGGLTPGAAADVLQQRLAETTIVLTGEGGDVELTGAELGASIDARALAESAFAEHPMWNPTQWFPESADANVVIDPITATAALRAAAPDLYSDPVDATLAYDATTATYVTTPAVPGEGIDVDAVLAAVRDAYDSGETSIELEPTLSPVEPTTTTAVAEETAASLNSILDNTGFYINGERTVPIDRAVAASWLTVTRDTDGSFDVAADQAAIQAVVDTLPAAVNREVVNATVITDSAGDVLRDVIAGTAGRTLGDTGNVASDFAAQLAAGNGVYELPVTVQEPTVTALARRIEVDISEQRTYLFENGNVVSSYAISSGLPGHDTDFGQFRIYAKVRLQNMGDRELIKADYFTPNVPYISYFNGDEALHGAYWHNNFGRRMSHGCVNMPVDVAAFVYDWAPIGTEVWVHA